MSIIIPVFLVCASILLWAVTLIMARSPQKHWWASELLMASIYIPGIIGFAVIGIIQLIQSFFIHQSELTIWSIIVAALIIIATALAVKLLDIGKRLARYERIGAQADVLQMPTPNQPDDHQKPPAKAA